MNSRVPLVGELYKDNAKLLMQNLGAEQTLGDAGKEETFVSSVGDAEEEEEDEAETDDANNAEDGTWFSLTHSLCAGIHTVMRIIKLNLFPVPVR